MKDNKEFNLPIIIIGIIFSAIFIATKKSIAMYVWFGIVVLYLIYEQARYKRFNDYTNLVIISLYSCILPDNYVVILISGILMIYYALNTIKQSRGIKIYEILLMVFLVANTLLSENKVINVLFFIIFNFTFLLYFYVFKNIKKLNIDKDLIKNSINNIVVIQIFATLSWVIFRLDFVLADLGGDWSTGTLGTFQGNILMLILAFTAIRYMKEYRHDKKIHKLVLILLSGVVIMSTACITNTLFLILAIVIYVMRSFLKSFKENMKYVLFVMVIGITFTTVMPTWVKEDLVNLTKYEYLVDRVKKLQTYKETFVDIPMKDSSYFLMGNGAGFYSSRAALTVGGEYVSGYEKILPVSLSKYTQEYIYEPLFQEEFDGSILSAPFSSVISVMGEFGIIGFMIFAVFMIKLYKGIKEEELIILLLFTLLCFSENWLEFAKVVIFFWASFYLSIDTKQECLEKEEEKGMI